MVLARLEEEGCFVISRRPITQFKAFILKPIVGYKTTLLVCTQVVTETITTKVKKSGYAIPMAQQSSRRGGEMLKLACVSMIRTGSSAGKKKRKFKVDEGRLHASHPSRPTVLLKNRAINPYSK